MKNINLHKNTIYIFLFVVFISSSCKITKPVEPITTAPGIIKVEEDWQSALKTSFRKHYKITANSHAKTMHAKYPVITQDLLNMTLIRSNGERVRFKMGHKAYSTLAHTSHTPLAVYSILYPSNFKLDIDSTFKKLKDYSLLLQNAKTGITNVTYLNGEQKERIYQLLTKTDDYIQKITANKKTSIEEYHNFAKSVRPIIEQNLYDGAMEQLTQFLKQLNDWKMEFPEENWDELRVAVLGFHQPRELYTQKLFFQWLLDEPAIEERVVYAEFQFSIFGKNKEKAEARALELLTKVDLEKEASLFLLGEETILQQDVMGPATKKILGEWGETKWFLDEN